MSPEKIIQLLLSLGDKLRDGSRWQASHRVDGKQIADRPQVTKFDCGLSADDGIWFVFHFKEGGQDQSLRGTYDLKNVGERIIWNGKNVTEDDIVVSHRARGAELRGVLEFQFEFGNELHRYRFDATLMRAI